MFLNNMGTDQEPADPYKVISMLKRKVKRRPDQRAVTALIRSLHRAIRKRSIEVERLRRNYGSLEKALMRQHLRDSTEIERLKREVRCLG